MTKRNINRWISLATALVVLGIAVGQHFGWLNGVEQQVAQAQPGLYAIDHFVDGDTIAVKMDGKIETVRMIGIDTPETHKPNAPVQCYGPAAAAYTKTLIGADTVRLEADEKSTNRDRYNRLLRYVYLPDGRLLEAELIKNGYAFAYVDFPFTKSGDFVSYQTAAKAASKGLWNNCQPYQLNSGRWQTNNQ